MNKFVCDPYKIRKKGQNLSSIDQWIFIKLKTYKGYNVHKPKLKKSDEE